ncbi:MAG: gas vesicle protein GvpJ [Gemmatimonadota bacterium]
MAELPADLRNHAADDVGLVELVNRVLDKGAVVSGDIVISVAGVDLLYLGLRVLLSSVETMRDREDRDDGG